VSSPVPAASPARRGPTASALPVTD
jgi:hypothetical protein